MTKAQRLTPVFVLVIVFLAVGWSLLPFEFTRGVDCGPPLLGAKPKSDVSVGLVIPEMDCKSKAKSRLLVSAMISLAAVGAGTAMVALRPLSPQCFGGNHDACPDWWANLVSSSGIGCQCECHSDLASQF